ncbi:MAG: hypothetical protein F4W90_09650, partial [Gammaproteobacteria bacterium]|nr:hypothetical protein [Gammaproteobacteria bacterium]
MPVEEALAKELADNRTLKEKYGTVEHYLWTLTVEELRPEKPRSVGNLSGRYDASLVREITDEFTGEFQSTVNVIWDEYVRRVGIAAAYTAL